MCRYFENFQSSTVCGPCAMCCVVVTLKFFKVPTHRGKTRKKIKVPSTGNFREKTNLSSTNTVAQKLATMLLSCIEVSFWNLSFCGEYIRSFKSIRLIFCVKKVLNSRSYPYPKFIKGFLYHFISGTGAFCKKAKLGFKRLWTLPLCKTLCNRTFICRSLQISECRFDPLSYKAISEKTLKAACTRLLLLVVFFLPLEISFFNIEVCFFFHFQADLIERLILSQSTLRFCLLFNSCGS